MTKLAEITASEAAKILGVGVRHVRWYHDQGLLTGRRVGERLLLFLREDVEAFVKPKRGRPISKAQGNGRAKKGKPHAH